MQSSAFVTVVSESPEVSFADFFNSVHFFAFNRGDAKAFYFRLVDKESSETFSVAHFTEKEPGLFVSSFRGTYGGIDTRQNDAALLTKFLEDMEQHLRSAGGREMLLHLAPLIYHPEQSALLTEILPRQGFSLVKQEINHFLHVDSVPLIGKMERNNAKRVRKCERGGCTFEELSEKDIPRVFDIIRLNRERKGYPVTITLDHMLRSAKAFPEEWRFFGVCLQGGLIAVSVCIRINPKTLYVLYWADIAEAHALSPVTFLAQELYKYCQSEEITLLDIGVSSENGVPNAGLTAFKKGLGCEESRKLSFGKTFS